VTAASSSSSQGRRLIWNTAAPEIYEGKESEVYSEAKRLGKNNHEFIVSKIVGGKISRLIIEPPIQGRYNVNVSCSWRQLKVYK